MPRTTRDMTRQEIFALPARLVGIVHQRAFVTRDLGEKVRFGDLLKKQAPNAQTTALTVRSVEGHAACRGVYTRASFAADCHPSLVADLLTDAESGANGARLSVHPAESDGLFVVAAHDDTDFVVSTIYYSP